MDEMNTEFIIEEADALLDGGSIFLVLRDTDGRKHRVELVQSMFPSPPGSGRLPGRLYFDDELVPIRSEIEVTLLSGLKNATGPTSVSPIRELAEELLRVVESERYSRLGASDRSQKR
jgi:hypothetical protein